MTDQQTLSHFAAAVETLRRAEPQTLRQTLVRAVEAEEAFHRLCCQPECVGGDCEDEAFTAAEEAQFETREALYQALAMLGIDRALANKIGRVLV